jgi:prepilin-type N-terminal cleavage/methylation domain-containing protein
MSVRSRQSGGSRRGFTLVEVIAALLIVGFAIIVFGASFPATSQAISRSRNTDLASDACQQQLEFWRNVGYSSLPAIPGGQSSVTQSFTPPADLQQGAGTITFTRVDANFAVSTANTGRVRVDVTVSWDGRGVDQGSVTLTTLILQ